MHKAINLLSDEDLLGIRGGGEFTPYNGIGGGGTYTTSGGTSFTVTPLQTSIGLSNQATNNLTSTLYTVGALAMQNPGLAAGSSAMGSILSLFNQGNGITITQPNFLPFPYGIHVWPRK